MLACYPNRDRDLHVLIDKDVDGPRVRTLTASLGYLSVCVTGTSYHVTTRNGRSTHDAMHPAVCKLSPNPNVTAANTHRTTYRFPPKNLGYPRTRGRYSKPRNSIDNSLR
jgi:hypothetical protein